MKYCIAWQETNFPNILSQSYDNLRNFVQCTLTWRQIYVGANFWKKSPSFLLYSMHRMRLSDLWQTWTTWPHHHYIALSSQSSCSTTDNLQTFFADAFCTHWSCHILSRQQCHGHTKPLLLFSSSRCQQSSLWTSADNAYDCWMRYSLCCHTDLEQSTYNSHELSTTSSFKRHFKAILFTRT